MKETQQDDGASLIIKDDIFFNFSEHKYMTCENMDSDLRASFWSPSLGRLQAQDFLDGLFVLPHGVLVVPFIL